MSTKKQHRDNQRRILQNAGWVAVHALKSNGSFQWRWIHPSKKKAYDREQAFNMACRRKA